MRGLRALWIFSTRLQRPSHSEWPVRFGLVWNLHPLPEHRLEHALAVSGLGHSLRCSPLSPKLDEFSKSPVPPHSVSYKAKRLL